MPNFAWKDLLANRNRRHFPEVVVPLASSSHAPSPSSPEPDAEKKPDAEGGSNTSLERASCQEKGIAAVPAYSTPLTLEELRTQVENEVSAGGHDSVYDRMSHYAYLFEYRLAGLSNQPHCPYPDSMLRILTLNHRQS